MANGNYSYPVNFYLTKYDYAFGRATMEFSYNKTRGFQPVGFFDYWNLDTKPWGKRSFGAESTTRFYNWYLNGNAFYIRYP